MFFLLSNVVFASSFVLILKWVQNRKREDIINVGAINYIVGALGSIPELALTSTSQFHVGAVATGASMGICYFIAFFFVIYAIRHIGASTTNMISALSILLPIGFAVVVWHEHPNVLQLMGITLAITALCMVGRSSQYLQKPANSGMFLLTLITFFLLAGLSRLSQDMFGQFSNVSQRPTFLFAAFAAAAIPSFFILAKRAFRISFMEAVFGVALGAVNILQTHFMLKSLNLFAGYIVFPVVSAGGLVFTATIAMLFLGEKVNRRSAFGLSIAVIALVLLNAKAHSP
jgi:drug/metabolite transporter (DMT)-like permease